MKTKKTYTRYRVGLFIGLFSFHTLASCVNKGGQLGMGCCESKEEKQKKQLKQEIKQAQEAKPLNHRTPNEDLKYNLAKEPWYKSKLGIGSFLMGVTLFTAGGITWYKLAESSSGSSAIAGTMNNRTLYNNGTKVPTDSNRIIMCNQSPKKYLDTNTIPRPRVNITINSTAIDKVRKANFSKESIEEFLRTSAIDVSDETGRTLLMYAAEDGNVEALKLLKNAGADLDATDEGENTASILASFGGNEENVQFFIDNCANPFIKNRANSTAKQVAEFRKYLSIAKMWEKAEQQWVVQHHNHKREASNAYTIPKLNEAEKIFERAQKKFGTSPYKKSRQRKK
ncbi:MULTISPECIES: ankyrin repeat domain-containing protein [Candidatus Cardinium]|uniref:ankyrin repeat domain-containing protein n=1 Tax=Candidatus Cardinium TaxID=273135 RepID=UPI001FAA1D38|nr:MULTISPECIES: ankyrin repeat domain-containing protein [Cardinium]